MFYEDVCMCIFHPCFVLDLQDGCLAFASEETKESKQKDELSFITFFSSLFTFNR